MAAGVLLLIDSSPDAEFNAYPGYLILITLAAS